MSSQRETDRERQRDRQTEIPLSLPFYSMNNTLRPILLIGCFFFCQVLKLCSLIDTDLSARNDFGLE